MWWAMSRVASYKLLKFVVLRCCHVSCLTQQSGMQNRTAQTGDALWVARSKADPRLSYALDYVVERKSIKDLVGSIKNGRYERQKYVLQRCGLRHVMYLIEGNPDVEVQGVSEASHSENIGAISRHN